MADAWRSLTRRFPAKPGRVDWLLAGAFTLAAELEVLIRLPQPSLEQELDTFGALALLGLAWRRRRPLIPLVLLTGSAVASVIAGARLPMDVPRVALLFATYSLGAYAGNIELGVGALLPTVMAACGVQKVHATIRQPAASTRSAGLPGESGRPLRPSAGEPPPLPAEPAARGSDAAAPRCSAPHTRSGRGRDGARP